MFFDGLSIATGVLALLMLLLGGRLLVRGGWLFSWMRGMSGVVFVGFASVMGLLAWDLKNYHQLVQDKPIASISFEKKAPQMYSAVLLMSDSGTPHEYVLSGDQWQIDARILRWSGWLRTLGGKPGYRLDRISGRYASVVDELQKPRTVYSLAQDEPGVDVWQWVHKADGRVPGVDAAYGSATFVPMADGALYELALSNSGLVAIPRNEAAERAVMGWQ